MPASPAPIASAIWYCAGVGVARADHPDRHAHRIARRTLAQRRGGDRRRRVARRWCRRFQRCLSCRLAKPLAGGHDRRARGGDQQRERRGRREIGSGLRDQAVELQRQDLKLRADQRERGAVGAEHHCGDQGRGCRRSVPASCGSMTWRNACAPVAPSDSATASWARSKFTNTGKNRHHDSRDQIVRRRERQADRREQRLADHRRVETQQRQQLRDQPGAAVAQDEPVGDDQAGEGERQSDHERQQRALPLGQSRQVHRDRHPDHDRKRRRDDREQRAAEKRRPERRLREHAGEGAAAAGHRVDRRLRRPAARRTAPARRPRVRPA